MNWKKMYRIAGATALASVSVASQAIVFGPGMNDIELINRENSYRPIANCVDVACLPAGTGGNAPPPGYLQVNPAIANNVQAGDVFVGIFASRSVTNNGSNTIPGQGTVWNEDNVPAGGIDTFTGYFAQQVYAVQLNVNGATDRIILGTATDAVFHVGGGSATFSLLGAGEVARAWVDNTSLANTPYVLNSGTLAASIASATDGSLFAGYTTGIPPAGGTPDLNGYVYSELDTGVPGNALNGTFFTAWMTGTKGPAYNLGTLRGINDPDEFFAGGSQPGDPLTTVGINFAGACAAFASATFACNDVVGNGQLTVNQSGGPWFFASEDPLQVFQVPEPGTLALLGFALAGMGFRRRKTA